MSRNGIGADGARALAQPLGCLTALMQLNLEHNAIDADGCLLYTSPSPRD